MLAGLGVAAGVTIVRLVADRPPKIEPGSRVLVFGDSHAEGLGPHLRAIAREEAVELLVVASRGTRMDQWASPSSALGGELDHALEQIDPDVVVVVLGTNDSYAQDGPRQTASFEELLDRLEGRGVVWVGPPALPEVGGRAPAPALVRMLEERAPHYFDSEDLELPTGPDGVHPTAAGYGTWAGALWQWLS